MASILFSVTPLSPEVHKKIFQGLNAFGKEKTGIAGDGLDVLPTSFEAWEGDCFVGAVVVKLFWGQMHVKYLYVDEAYRGKGIASRLMEGAISLAREERCDFIFVETLSFQALDFYTKHGFELEFTRPGYACGASFHYLKKKLDQR